MSVGLIVQFMVALLAAAGFAALVAVSVLGVAKVTALSLLAVGAAIALGIWGQSALQVAGAGVAVGVGLGGVILVCRSRAGTPATARRLRLLAALCCLLVGAILTVPRFPPDSPSARAAWLSVGYLAWWVYGVFVNPAASGRAAEEPRPVQSGGSAPVIPWGLDVLALVVSLVFATVHLLDPSVDAYGTVLVLVIGVFLLGFASMLAQWVMDPPSFLKGQPVAGMGWIGLAIMLFGWALTATEAISTPLDAKALGWVVMGVGPGVIAWVLLIRPWLSGFRTLPAVVVRATRRRKGSGQAEG